MICQLMYEWHHPSSSSSWCHVMLQDNSWIPFCTQLYLCQGHMEAITDSYLSINWCPQLPPPWLPLLRNDTLHFVVCREDSTVLVHCEVRHLTTYLDQTCYAEEMNLWLDCLFGAAGGLEDHPFVIGNGHFTLNRGTIYRWSTTCDLPLEIIY